VALEGLRIARSYFFLESRLKTLPIFIRPDIQVALEGAPHALDRRE
jgi:hypothetical protein